MIDIQTETLVPINEIPSHVPGRTHIATCWRWIQRGCRGVKLETVPDWLQKVTAANAFGQLRQQNRSHPTAFARCTAVEARDD